MRRRPSSGATDSSDTSALIQEACFDAMTGEFDRARERDQ